MYVKVDETKAKMHTCFAYNTRNVLLQVKKKYRERDDRLFLCVCCKKGIEYYCSNGGMLSENNRRLLFCEIKKDALNTLAYGSHDNYYKLV